MLSALVGFVLLFFIVSAASSLLLTGALLIQRGRLRAIGPWIERWASVAALALPPFFGAFVTVLLGLHSAEALTAGTDHCMDHPHHLHLCWAHGTLWITSPIAMGAAAFLMLSTMSRTAAVLYAHLRAHLTVTELLRIAAPIAGMPRAFLVPSEALFAFTAGIGRPVILISQAAWNGLDVEERRALVAHEQSHIHRGDIFKRTVLAILGAFGVPGVTPRTLAVFDAASERLCDLEASGVVGKPSIVARAILFLARSRTAPPTPAAALRAAGCEVTERIHTLFQSSRSGKSAARRLGFLGAAAISVIALTTAFHAERLHHFFETILG